MDTPEGNSYTTSSDYDDFEANRTADGIVGRDLSLVEYPTRSYTKLKTEKDTMIKEWTAEQQEKVFRFSRASMLGTSFCDNKEVASALYESSSIKDSLKDFFRETESQVEPLKALMKAAEKEGKKLEIMGFSKMDQPTLDRIGVTHHDVANRFSVDFVQKYMALAEAHFRSRLNQDTTFVKHFDLYWPGNYKNSTYLRTLDYYMDSVPHIVEASSRRVIDTIVIGLIDPLIALDLEQIHIPELKVRLIGHGETPVVTVIDSVGSHNGSAANKSGPPAVIVLRGAIDYTIVSKSSKPPGSVVTEPVASGGGNAAPGMLYVLTHHGRGQWSSCGATTHTDSYPSDTGGLQSRLSDNYDVSSVVSSSMDNESGFGILLVEAKRPARCSSTTGGPAHDPKAIA